MTLEHIVIALIVGAVLWVGGRSLWRAWSGTAPGGCAGCRSCGSRESCDAAAARLVGRDTPVDSGAQDHREAPR
jgi:hypothetical protein